MKRAASCLQLDVGNSGAKWRLLQEDEVTARGIYRATNTDSRDQLLAAATQLQQVWISSVADAEAEAQLRDLVRENWQVEPWFARTPAASGDLRNSYAQPDRMGVDRWLAMLAAWERLRCPLCVVDAGSALTIDLVDGSGQHSGGYIIPGSFLMERALLLDTDRVRFAEQVEYGLTPGVSTAEAVRHGIALAQVGAIGLAIERAQQPLQLVFTGGGAQQLRELLGRGGEFVPDLVFEGLEIMACQSG